MSRHASDVDTEQGWRQGSILRCYSNSEKWTALCSIVQRRRTHQWHQSIRPAVFLVFVLDSVRPMRHGGLSRDVVSDERILSQVAIQGENNDRTESTFTLIYGGSETSSDP